MPRAEIGSTKHASNKLKSKGLQRLRWYCQACERQMRDENGFKCHVGTESHVRNMMLIGEDPRKAINDFSNQFVSDFIKLLRTSHGEKKINVNHSYQEYISDKQHVHMNATRWSSLTEFAKYLGRQGLCRVEEEEADSNGRGGGLMIAWIDNSPEALRRQDALRKKERQDRGDEEREWKGIREQITRARKEGLGDGDDEEQEEKEEKEEQEEEEEEEEEEAARILQRKEGEKIKLNFGTKRTTVATKDDDKDFAAKNLPSPPVTEKDSSGGEEKADDQEPKSKSPDAAAIAGRPAAAKISTNPSASFSSPAPRNPLVSAPKKNPLSMAKRSKIAPPPHKMMSEAERIMRSEIEGKSRRKVDGNGGRNVSKRQRLA